MIKVIAEAGVNHFGKVDLAKRLVDSAKQAGADFIKFQFIEPDEVYLPGRYKYGPYNSEDVVKQRAESLLDYDQCREVFEYAKSADVEPFATPFGLKSLDLLSKLGCTIVKIASGDINFYDLISEASNRFDIIVMSTGMATAEEVRRAYDIASRGSAEIYLMHCVSIYPHTESQSNLGFIRTLLSEYDVSVGYSDHTLGSLSSCCALTLGATLFEKHFTLDRSMGGLDRKHSLEPDEFKKYVDDLRAIEHSLTVVEKDVNQAEAYTAQRARRGLYFAKSLPKGHVITKDDVLFLRPSNGLDLLDLNKVVGKRLLSDVQIYQSLEAREYDD
jgi:N,N'-diacetyllegionaminate synthase